jgi:hypothetical protein
MLELAITHANTVLGFARNARTITLPNGVVIWGPIVRLPQQVGDYTIRKTLERGPMPGPLQGMNKSLPFIEGDLVVVERTVYTVVDAVDAAARLLHAAKQEAKIGIDIDAEAARLKWVTPGAAQSMVYDRKAAQAEQCLATHAAEDPIETGVYPALDAEVGITGATIYAVAATVIAMRDAWGPVADVIENLRLAAKGAVSEATTPEEARAIRQNIAWPPGPPEYL